jgi:2-polyprenyl-3-methyl-5-hydroxy-6-metoxy-1,4-benzoquinol methylase
MPRVDPPDLVAPPAPRKDIFQEAYEAHLTGIQTNGGREVLSTPRLPEDLSNLVPLYANADILEIGTGHGGLVGALAELGHTGVVALDVSQKLLEAVRARYGDKLRGSYWGDAKDFLDRNLESFDLIIMFDVLEHFQESELSALLIALKGALRRGGRLVLRTPNMAVPLGVFSRYIDFTHKTAFTEFSLHQVLEAHGFRHVTQVAQRRRAGAIRRIVFGIYRRLLRAWYRMEDRTVPNCLDKNLLMTCVK